jgi:hypothetical protein
MCRSDRRPKRPRMGMLRDDVGMRAHWQRTERNRQAIGAVGRGAGNPRRICHLSYPVSVTALSGRRSDPFASTLWICLENFIVPSALALGQPAPFGLATSSCPSAKSSASDFPKEARKNAHSGCMSAHRLRRPRIPALLLHNLANPREREVHRINPLPAQRRARNKRGTTRGADLLVSIEHDVP